MIRTVQQSTFLAKRLFVPQRPKATVKPGSKALKLDWSSTGNALLFERGVRRQGRPSVAIGLEEAEVSLGHLL